MNGARFLGALGLVMLAAFGCDSSLSGFTRQALGEGGSATVEPPPSSGGVGASAGMGTGGSTVPPPPGEGGAEDPGAGGSSAAAGATSVAGVPNGPQPLLVDDFEDGDIQAYAPIGWWYLVNDGTGTQDIGVELATNREEPSHALRTAGFDFDDWGAALGLNLKPKTNKFDASSYGSVRFWARAGSSSSTQVSVEILDLQHAHYRSRIVLTNDWLLYDLKLANFLSVADDNRVLDPSAIEALQFFTVSGRPFELWFDDVSFEP